MNIVPLQALPNQAFSIVLDNNQWDFVLKTTNGVVSVTLSLNGSLIMSNMRAVANQLVIPSIYQESGNFLFLTQNFLLPDYTQFGITQYLVYLNASELATARIPDSLPITASDFNAIAALPLRFAPQDYAQAPVGGMIEWFDGSRTPAGAVTSWADYSGNGYNATQSGAGKPVSTANQQNGLSTVLFASASSQDLVMPSALYALPNENCTVFAVAKRNIEDGSNERIIGMTNGGGTNFRFILGFGATAGQVIFGNNATGATIGNTGNTNTNYQIITAFRSGTTQSLSVNGNTPVTDTGGTSVATITTANIGSSAGASRFLNGGIAELIIYPFALTSDEIAYNESLLSSKWGIAIA